MTYLGQVFFAPGKMNVPKNLNWDLEENLYMNTAAPKNVMKVFSRNHKNVCTAFFAELLLIQHDICMLEFHTGMKWWSRICIYTFRAWRMCTRRAIKDRKFQLSHKYATAGIIKVNTLSCNKREFFSTFIWSARSGSAGTESAKFCFGVRPRATYSPQHTHITHANTVVIIVVVAFLGSRGIF